MSESSESDGKEPGTLGETGRDPAHPRKRQRATAAAGVENRRPTFAVAAVGLVACAGTLLWRGSGAAVGVAIGAAFATANLWAFTRIGQGVLGRNGVAWGLIAAAKLVLLFGGALAVLSTHRAAPLPFMVGYLALPVGIVLGQLLGPRSEFQDDEGSI